MNINSQFPPSSPLLHSENELDNAPFKDGFDSLSKAKPFKSTTRDEQREKDKYDTYPTPDPSSSLGDVSITSDNLEAEESMIKIAADSSPSKMSRVAPEEAEFLRDVKRAKLDESTGIDASQPLSTKNFQNVMYIPLNGDVFKIGRSGLSCSFKLNSSNKLISRVHAEIQFDMETQMIVLKCLGFNGLNVTIPKLIDVENIKDKEFLIKVNGEDMKEENDGVSEADPSKSRILTRSSAFTNFYMLKDESIKMPLIEGTVLDFRGDLALLVYKKDPLNLASQNAARSSFVDKPNRRKLSTGDLLKIVEEKKLQFSTHPTLAELKEKKSVVLSPSLSGARPIVRKNLANTIIYKRASPAPCELQPAEEHVSKKVSGGPKASAVSPVKSDSTKIMKKPFGDITNMHNKTAAAPPIEKKKAAGVANKNSAPQALVATTTVVKENEPPLPPALETPLTGKPAAREDRSKTPEPKAADLHAEEQKKRGRAKKTKQSEEDILRSMPQTEVDAVLSTVPQLANISNLVTNHIAYSRILQTPFSSIRDLNSIKKHNLTKLQLRCLLIHSVPCIGVIFRQGKDAAGKPLDEEYYYVPEKDSDIHRVQLVEELKGSSSHLRSCRKTHKQYFWKKPKL
ncbi:hypothetical protein PMKS-000459 [Pichia membranifaciens]|uniref:FHA domain-containing protein n=1 Tax=Pichia membranifaciens TaxID=4926 RepID=A0A1Q2YBX5_9ASCO|nr:hypothetical protein PMKS-000459 [Pichia membranifaciens]